MKGIGELGEAVAKVRLGIADASICVGWAAARLEADEDERDSDVACLAGERDPREAMLLAERILSKSDGGTAVDVLFIAGRYISHLRGEYEAKRVDLRSLDAAFDRLSEALGYPTWMVQLCRNCEYATDTEPFIRPFEAELRYVAGLWDAAGSTEEFLRRYDRMVSDSHDVAR